MAWKEGYLGFVYIETHLSVSFKWGSVPASVLLLNTEGNVSSRAIFVQGGLLSWLFLLTVGFFQDQVISQGGLSSGWSLIRVISAKGGLSSGWSLIRVIFPQGGLSSVWSFISIICHQGHFSSGWSLVSIISRLFRVASGQNHLSSGSFFLRVVFLQCGLSSASSLIKVIFPQDGLWSASSLIRVIFPQDCLSSGWPLKSHQGFLLGTICSFGWLVGFEGCPHSI